ncbi:MAG: amidohydrolase family protein, partial [Candidatus Aminicenantes bacterium]|nr:amidohydrolase family protein [Candidatus Aminicenantes bacterium]
TGKFVVPGLFDCHTHLAFLKTEGEKDPQKGLQAFVSKGITQVRDVGGPLNVLNQMNKRISSGEILGPELFFTGPMLEKSPLLWKDFNKILPGFTVAINTKEDVDKMLPELSNNGACLVKTFNKFDKDVYKYLTEVARKYSLKVVHDPGTILFHEMPMDRAIELGVTSIEHGKAPWPVVLTDDLQKKHDELLADKADEPERKAFLSRVSKLGIESVSTKKLQKLISMMVENNVFFCPTLQVFPRMAEPEFPENMPEEEKAMKRQNLRALVQVSDYFTREIARQNVKILVGQDGILPEGTFAETRLLKEVGLSESEIIKGATIYPAQWLGVEDRLGSISPGKQANLLVLEKNPLEDIDNLRSTFLVTLNGKVVFH